MKIFFLNVLFFALASCSQPGKDQELNSIDKEDVVTESNGLQAVVLEYGSGEFGYQILENGKLLIDQQHIPAVQGLKRFKTREEAQRLGEHVKSMIQKGIMPPTVSINDLDSLYISY